MGGKLKAGMILFLMYGLGIGSGVAWEVHHSRHQSPRQLFGERRIAHLKQKLQLTPWQETTLREIVQDAHERANDVHDGLEYDLAKIKADSLDAIQQLLTPEQRQQFEAMRAKHHAKHRDDHERQGEEKSS